MAEFQTHSLSSGAQASAVVNVYSGLNRDFSTLRIKAGEDVVVLYLDIEDAAWAERVAQAVNAPRRPATTEQEAA